MEKPLGLNAAEAREVSAAATQRRVFCAEAMWTFSLPRFDVVRQVLADGLLGEFRTVMADHGEWFPDTHRIFRADLAGGPLLDLGTYPVALAVALLGPPDEVLAVSADAPTGVHGQVSAVLRHRDGAQSLLSTTLFSTTPTTAVLAGTEATLVLPGPFFGPGDVEVHAADRTQTVYYREPATAHDALHHQAAEAATRICAGETWTPRRPPADTVATLEVVDAIRGRIGVTYPGEAAPGVPTGPEDSAAQDRSSSAGVAGRSFLRCEDMAVAGTGQRSGPLSGAAHRSRTRRSVQDRETQIIMQSLPSLS